MASSSVRADCRLCVRLVAPDCVSAPLRFSAIALSGMTCRPHAPSRGDACFRELQPYHRPAEATSQDEWRTLWITAPSASLLECWRGLPRVASSLSSPLFGATCCAKAVAPTLQGKNHPRACNPLAAVLHETCPNARSPETRGFEAMGAGGSSIGLLSTGRRTTFLSATRPCPNVTPILEIHLIVEHRHCELRHCPNAPYFSRRCRRV